MIQIVLKVLMLVIIPATACHAEIPVINFESEGETIVTLEALGSDVPFTNPLEHSGILYDQANSNTSLKLNGYLRRANISFCRPFSSLFTRQRDANTGIFPISLFILFRNLRL